MQINATIDDKEVQSLLGRVARRVDNMEPVLRTIGETVVRSIRKTFTVGGRPDRWPKSKRAKIQGGQTLVDTGVLKNNITVQAADKNSVTVGTSAKQAGVMHFGAKKGSFGTFAVKVKSHDRTITQAFGKQLASPVTATVKGHTRSVKLPWGDIPARPFLMIQDEDWDEIRAELGGYLV